MGSRKQARYLKARASGLLSAAESLAEYAVARESALAARQVIVQGDCLDVLARLPDDCVDLVVTSPPYADRRKSSYGGIHPDKYVEWFMPRAAESKRVLREEGKHYPGTITKARENQRWRPKHMR